MPEDAPKPTTTKLTVRFSDDMLGRLRAASKASGRPLNGEIIACVAAGLEGGGIDVDELAERIVDALVARLAAGVSPAARPAKRKR